MTTRTEKGPRDVELVAWRLLAEAFADAETDRLRGSEFIDPHVGTANCWKCGTPRTATQGAGPGGLCMPCAVRLAMAGDMVRPAQLADYCRACEDLGATTTCYPVRWVVDHDEEWVKGAYQCPAGHHWTCGWSMRQARDGAP